MGLGLGFECAALAATQQAAASARYALGTAAHCW